MCIDWLYTNCEKMSGGTDAHTLLAALSPHTHPILETPMRCMITSFALWLPIAASLTSGGVAVAQTPGSATPTAQNATTQQRTDPMSSEMVGTIPLAWKDRLERSLAPLLQEMPDGQLSLEFQRVNFGNGLGYAVDLCGRSSALRALAPKAKELFQKFNAEAKPFAVAMYKQRDVDFPGGKPDDFLRLILPKEVPVNVLYRSQALRDAVLPPLRARQVTGFTALELMSSLLSDPNAGNAQFLSFEMLRSEGQVTHSDELDQGDAVTIMVQGRTPRPGVSDPMESSVLRIMSADAESPAAREEQRKQQDRVLRAIDDAMEFKGGPSPNFRVKLNTDTGILFVAGSQQERATVAAVIAAIMNPPGKAAQTRDADPAAAVPAAGAASTTGTTGDRKSGNTPATRGQQQQPR